MDKFFSCVYLLDFVVLYILCIMWIRGSFFRVNLCMYYNGIMLLYGLFIGIIDCFERER